MHSKSSASAFPAGAPKYSKALRNLASVSAVALMSLFAVGCDSDSEDVDTTIQIVEPANGGTYKLSEKLRIITKSDYSKFSSGLNYQLSKDGKKNWEAMISTVKKQGIALDTLMWDPIMDPPTDVPVGQPVYIRVIDYDKHHFTISKALTFTN